MHETPTTALARNRFICTKCGREWTDLWTRKDAIRDIPRWVKEIRWWEVPEAIVFAPFMIVFDLFFKPHCPICEGECIERFDAPTVDR